MSQAVEKIKERLSIVDVIADYITVEKAGSQFKAKCPFHHEKTPSFFISPERNTYYCFGCGEKGDIFSFVQNFESIDFKGSLTLLAEKAGVELTQYKANIKADDETDLLYKALERATVFFQQNLKEHKESLLYLKGRGLSIDFLNQFRLGFAQDEWRSLKETLQREGFSEHILEKAGLIKRGGEGVYDRFRARIIFPITDIAGRVVGFSGRTIKKDEEAKYLNSPETPLFLKSKILFGFDKAKKAIREKRFAVLVEGQMDLIMSHQSGVTNTVATSGTSLTEEHLELLSRFTDTLVIAFDQDNAGLNASLKAWQMALAKGFEVKVASIASGKDPADQVKEDPESWKISVEKAEHIIEHFILSVKGKSEKEQDDIAKNKILPLIRSLSSAIDQSRFVKMLASVIKVNEDVIWSDLAKIGVSAGVMAEDKKFVGKKSITSILRKVAGFYLMLKEQDAPRGKSFFEAVHKILNFEIPDSYLTEEVYFEGVMYFGNSPNIDAYEVELLFSLEEDVLKERFKDKMDELRKAELIKDGDIVRERLKECQEISIKLSALKNKYSNT